MIDVNVCVNAILLYCDESLENVCLGNGYTIKKTYLNDFEHRDRISDTLGNLSIDYMGSRIFDDANNIYFMCIHKHEILKIPAPEIEPGKTYTDNDLSCHESISMYQDNECTFLNNIFNMMHLFKCGNIGTKTIFFDYNYCVMGFLNNNIKHSSNNVTRNIVDNRFYCLSSEEIADCNQFIARVNSNEFHLIKNIIDEFAWGLEQIDLPTGFEQYTTALEMMFLEQNQKNKKECLSKRIAALIGTTDGEKTTLYNKIKDFYRYRSESLHEGDGKNITKTELIELEEITRQSIVCILDLCKNILISYPSFTWENIKSSIISDLKNQVVVLISNGILPS